MSNQRSAVSGQKLKNVPRPLSLVPALLVLEDGYHQFGKAFAADGEVLGEVVFNTSMTGYQEILTDPSYSGQIVTMTYPQIGNYGINDEDVESEEIHSRAFIIREFSPIVSNWRAEGDLGSWLDTNGVVAIEEIDTRALTKHIRSAGAMRGAVSTTDLNPQSLLKKVKDFPRMEGSNLVDRVTSSRPELISPIGKKNFSVAAIDCGVKRSILRHLRMLGAEIILLPAQTTADEILKIKPDGIFLTNGPGDPAAVTNVQKTVKQLLGKVPIFGICLGHQILSLALGAKTFKLKFGHRGANHPVKNLNTGKVEITSQNHGFAVDKNDPIFAKGKVEITHLNLNDDTVEGLRCLDLPAFSVQYHPEASPGPHDSHYLFNDFTRLMEEHK